MTKIIPKKLLEREMTRKEFLAFSVFAVASVFGITGLIKTLLSHAATPTASLQLENGTRTGNANTVSDASASGSTAVKFSSTGSTVPGGTISHGEQLSINHVGPWTLQGVAKGSESVTALNPGTERVSTYPGNARPSWIPGTAYVYNNNPSNLGGIVPAGGMVIDGYNVPAGTWVVQFRSFTAGIIIEGDCGGAGSAFPGILFRGCRMRGGWYAPGWFNQNGQSPGGTIWIMYSDAGGKSTASADYCESIFESKRYDPTDKFYCIRSYLSNATTLVFLRNDGDAAIENYGENVLDFGDSTKHLNGIANGGGENATLWLRNHLVLAKQAGSTQINDVIQMAADGGAYLGTATNFDGSTGYTIKDNYLGGAGHTLQLGYDKSNTIDKVRNVHVIGNKFTTSLYADSGESGLCYKTPDFSNYGNTWSGNTWADGPKAGQTIPAPAASN
ncbi:hypothetical protein EYC59_03785 [Candidatus Saccharibacteria bacterium]|nr:MAG: hypothetical protein EYC59_03785 [Candidatus Saccharibacteria bacterium]